MLVCRRIYLLTDKHIIVELFLAVNKILAEMGVKFRTSEREMECDS